jgi:hypothetical protein
VELSTSHVKADLHKAYNSIRESDTTYTFYYHPQYCTGADVCTCEVEIHLRNLSRYPRLASQVEPQESAARATVELLDNKCRISNTAYNHNSLT